MKASIEFLSEGTAPGGLFTCAVGAFCGRRPTVWMLAAERAEPTFQDLLLEGRSRSALREPLQARLKASCKCVLIQFGANAARAENVAERLVACLHVQAPEMGSGIPLAQVAVEGIKA